LQEFWRGTRVRMRNAGEGFFTALFELVTRAKRRHGGYIVHLGLVAMYFGFTGAAYDTEKEAALRPGQTMEVRGFKLRYDGTRMEVDPNRRMIFTDLSVLHGDKRIAGLSPAKYVYSKPQDTATTEVAIRSTLSEDIYAIMSNVQPQTKLATFRIIVRPFVAWIWLGAMFMIIGTSICAAPSVREVLGEASARKGARGPMPAMATTLLIIVTTGALLLGWSTFAHAQADGSSSLHAGSVTMHNPHEKQLFERLLCMCGDCQRLPLSTCSCSVADDLRAKIRAKIAAGVPDLKIQDDYREEFGAQAIAIPSDKGLDRALWAVPVAAIAVAAGLLIWRGRKWVAPPPAPAGASGLAPNAAEGYDAALDAELRKLDE
jgi:cytochrome c-type biogenesis protein CcmF